MKYYIGVDGGGTKTAFALFDENKNMLETVTGAGSNHENLETAFDGASDIIINGLNELCEKAGIKLADVSFTLMGLAGIDHPYQYDIMCGKLREKGLDNFEVFNDGFIVVKAGATGSLSEQSIALGSAPVAFPDFTNGMWIDREPIRRGKYCLDEVCNEFFE